MSVLNPLPVQLEDDINCYLFVIVFCPSLYRSIMPIKTVIKKDVPSQTFLIKGVLIRTFFYHQETRTESMSQTRLLYGKGLVVHWSKSIVAGKTMSLSADDTDEKCQRPCCNDIGKLRLATICQQLVNSMVTNACNTSWVPGKIAQWSNLVPRLNV